MSTACWDTPTRGGENSGSPKDLQQITDLSERQYFFAGVERRESMRAWAKRTRLSVARKGLRRASLGDPGSKSIRRSTASARTRGLPIYCGDAPGRQVAAKNEQPIDTLAVLPFDNQSPDPEAGYLGDDITYSLTDSLARVRELKVRPYSSAARFKAGSTDAKTAGRELQVQAVLRGSIQKRGEDIVIEVELMHVGEDRRIWGNRYPGKLADRLALQQQIIQEVPERLRLSLTGQEKQALAKLPTQSLKAHELYILGRLEWNKRNRPGLERSIDLFRQATELDPNLCAGLGRPGRGVSCISTQYRFPSAGLHAPKRKLPRCKALEIDDQLAEAHTVLASIAGAYEWDWSEAETGFQRAWCSTRTMRGSLPV